MMTLISIIYFGLLLVAVIVTGAMAVRRNVGHRHNKRFESLLSQRYMRIVSAIMLSNESLPSRFPMVAHRGAKEVLAQVLATVAVAVYGPDVAILGRIAVDNGLDDWLLRRVVRSRGFARAHYLSLLASLPLTSEVVGEISRYADDKNPFVRFYALLIRVGNDSASALREIAEYGNPLNGFEVAEIMAMLRRGMLPVACEPLLASTNRNLRYVGLNIAREFGIEEAKPLLLDIAASESDGEVAQEALYALVSMHSSLAHREIAESVRHLVGVERRALCRRLAFEGYSANALERLFGGREGAYAERLVATYKRRIVCIPQI